MIGEQIKLQRTKCNMTQKELADKLYVTSQAVSRWENGEVEPSISTISEMAKIFNISIDELVNEKKEVEEKIEPIEEAPADQKINTEELLQKVEAMIPKVPLCVCEKCNSPIYEQASIHRFTTKQLHKSGRHHTYDDISHIYCDKCYERKIEEDKAAEHYKELARLERIKKRRIHSFIWPSIILIILMWIAVAQINKNDTAATILFICAPLSFTMLGCLILGDNCVGDVFMSLVKWGVKFPGLIFSLDLDGIIWFILVKLTFAIISVCISLVTVAFATAVAMVVGIFVYPFALKKNLNNESQV